LQHYATSGDDMKSWRWWCFQGMHF